MSSRVAFMLIMDFEMVSYVYVDGSLYYEPGEADIWRRPSEMDVSEGGPLDCTELIGSHQKTLYAAVGIVKVNSNSFFIRCPVGKWH
jgi:hypothetical protein